MSVLAHSLIYIHDSCIDPTCVLMLVKHILLPEARGDLRNS